MCGIVGVMSTTPIAERGWLSTATYTLRHRGPDASGIWWSHDGRVGLGHRRLAVIDLTDLANQPMHLPSTSLSIVFNGEIYNYRELRKDLQRKGHIFYTESDTEVLLNAYAAWGQKCVSRLEGMFAFAIYDSARASLFLARDPMGEKPLFYFCTDRVLYFASELKALLTNPTLPRQIDPVSLDCYLAHGAVPGGRCILRGFHKLPPAHSVEFNTRTGLACPTRYWTLPEYEPTFSTAAEDELLDEVELVLNDAIRKQIHADVPVGVLLSGGVDSSIVTALASRASSNIHTFSVSFPGAGHLDETQHARLVAGHFGTTHTEIIAEPTDILSIPMLAAQFDEPLADSSMLPTWIVCNLVRQHCTVALGGDGGDELFGGYRHYTEILFASQRLRHIPRPLRHIAAVLGEKLFPLGLAGRSWLRRLDFDTEHGVPPVSRLFDKRMRKRLLHHQDVPSHSAERLREALVVANNDIVQRLTRLDFQTYLPDDILVKTDRASMLASLELRSPFLDRRVVEFAFRKVPSLLKVTPYTGKILLKRLASRLLPSSFDLTRKQGFSAPLAAWLRNGSCHDLFEDVIGSRDYIFDRKISRALLKSQGRWFRNEERLFGLIFIDLWRRAYGAYL